MSKSEKGLALLSKLVCTTLRKLTPGHPSSGSRMPPGGLGSLETSGRGVLSTVSHISWVGLQSYSEQSTKKKFLLSMQPPGRFASIQHQLY